MFSSTYVWAKVLSHMEELLGAVTVSAWFDDAEVVELNEEHLILYSSSDFRREIIRRRCTDYIHDALKDTMRNKNDYTQTKVPGSIIFYDMQPFNKLFVNLSIGLILLSCFLFVMNTHVRRKYYIGNYVAIGAYSAGALALTVGLIFRSPPLPISS